MIDRRSYWKRAACAILAVLLAASLAACGQGEEPSSSTGSSSQAQSGAGESKATDSDLVPEGAAPPPVSDSDLVPEEDPPPASPGDLAVVYDPMVAAGAYSDHGALFADIQRNGKDLPAYVWWVNEQVLREAFGIDGYLDGQSSEGVAHFSCQQSKGREDTAKLYGLTAAQMRETEMKSWPYASWARLADSFDFYVTLRKATQPPQPDAWDVASYRPVEDERSAERLMAGPNNGAGTPTPKSVSGDRQPVEDYQPPVWEAVEGHEGYEQAVVEETAGGVPLAVRLRWQEDGHWFLCQIPGHSLESFWEAGDSLWEKRELPGEMPADDEWTIAPKMEEDYPHEVGPSEVACSRPGESL